MGYSDPNGVIAPKTRWSLGQVICNTGQQGWSAAEGFWDGEPSLGIRWNGDDESGSPGNPQSHGNPTWFIVPTELEDAVHIAAHRVNEVKSFVSCEISRPEEFKVGVFMVTIKLQGNILQKIAGHSIVFSLPKLPKRLFRPDAQYSVPPADQNESWKGRFVDGVWQSILQTNGISEENNPTSLKIVQDTLVAKVMSALAPWQHQQSAIPNARVQSI